MVCCVQMVSHGITFFWISAPPLCRITYIAHWVPGLHFHISSLTYLLSRETVCYKINKLKLYTLKMAFYKLYWQVLTPTQAYPSLHSQRDAIHKIRYILFSGQRLRCIKKWRHWISAKNNSRGIHYFMLHNYVYTLVPFTLVSTIKTGVREWRTH